MQILRFQALWQRVKATPLPSPEDSIPLRILVQGLVTLGMIATTVAAVDATDALRTSLWAIPVSGMGAIWSYRCRHRRNIALKFCLALGMLVALTVFFQQLWTDRHDTRLALASLLIHLQVLHSFDLPRRKDLGYSAVIGLILISVAATLSQTLTFAPLLLLFLVIAVPVLILDYRSRLGLSALSFQQVRLDLAPRRLGLVILVTLGLGLTIFLALPRFPGYQLRSFPVSAPISWQGEFDRSTVLNPGYVREGQGGSGRRESQVGAGEIDEESYYGFDTQINQNLRGQMIPKIVMRIRSQAPGFWRVLAFDHYTGQGWKISRNADEQVQQFDRPSWSFRFVLPWEATLNRTREVVQSYTIVSDLPNLLPALFAPKELYFPTQQIALDKEGGLRSPVPLAEGLTYTVVSEVPYRDRTLLQQAEGSPPPYIQDHYLQIPDAIAERIRAHTEAVLANSPKPLEAASEKALYLAQYLKQHYAILPNLPFFAGNEDLVEAFLFVHEGGYPDHFATVLTVMLRAIDIPARLAVGFAPGEFNVFTGYYVVKNTDAYALTEVYFPKYGWFAFDPIPGHPLIPPSIEDSKLFGVLQQFWNWIAGWLPTPVSSILIGIAAWLGTGIDAILTWVMPIFTQGWQGLLAGGSLLIAISFCSWLGWKGWRWWCHRRWLAQLPPMEALYQRMLRILAAQGMPKRSHQTPFDFVQACQASYPPEQVQRIAAVSQAYVTWRYGRRVPAAHDLMRLRHDLIELRRRSSGQKSKRPTSRDQRSRGLGADKC